MAYTRSYCGPALDMVRQRRMTTDAHRVVHGVSITGQEPVPPINPEFTRRMITGGTRGARKGGLETWWRSPAGIEARVASCNGGSNKCGIRNTNLDNNRGNPPRCASCNAGDA